MDSRMRKDLGPQMIQGLVQALLELAKHDIDAANKIATDVLAEISELEEKP